MSSVTSHSLAWLLGVAGSLAAAHVWATTPSATPSVYVTNNYALTFKPPPASTYCPLPDRWVGSDHGTTIFLQKPSACGGAGYPSSSRDFEPTNVSRIEVYYGYALDEDEVIKSAKACDRVGRVRFLERERPLCRVKHGQDIEVSVSGRYDADGPAEATMRLVTTSRTYAADMKVFASVADSFHSCTVAWQAGDKRETYGAGQPCPKGAWF